jgi:hypothetical protein
LFPKKADYDEVIPIGRPKKAKRSPPMAGSSDNPRMSFEHNYTYITCKCKGSHDDPLAALSN